MTRYAATAFSRSCSIIAFNAPLTGMRLAGKGSVTVVTFCPRFDLLSTGGACTTSDTLFLWDASWNSVARAGLARRTKGSTEVSGVAFGLTLPDGSVVVVS